MYVRAAYLKKHRKGYHFYISDQKKKPVHKCDMAMGQEFRQDVCICTDISAYISLSHFTNLLNYLIAR